MLGQVLGQVFAGLLGALSPLWEQPPTRKVLFDSAVYGLNIGLLALGIVLTYRSTKVINFAVGNMGLPGATLFALLVVKWDWPFWPALAVSLLLGMAIGLAIDLTVIWRLFNQPRVILLVASVGLAQLLAAANAQLPDMPTDNAQIGFPAAISSDFNVAGIAIRGAQVQTLIMVPIITVGLALWLNRTTFGKAVTASADNAPLARLAGIRPRTVSTIVWVMSGLLATLTMSLLSSGGPTTGVQNLGYGTLNLALVAAVIAGMRSFPRAMLGGIFIGLLSGLVTWWRLWDVVDQGFASFVFFGIVFIAVWRQARSTDDELMAFTPKVPPIPDHVREIWWIRNLSRLAVTAALLVVIAIIALLMGRLVPDCFRPLKGLLKTPLPCFYKARCCFNAPRNRSIARVPVRRLGDENDR